MHKYFLPVFWSNYWGTQMHQDTFFWFFIRLPCAIAVACWSTSEFSSSALWLPSSKSVFWSIIKHVQYLNSFTKWRNLQAVCEELPHGSFAIKQKKKRKKKCHERGRQPWGLHLDPSESKLVELSHFCLCPCLPRLVFCLVVSVFFCVSH